MDASRVEWAGIGLRGHLIAPGARCPCCSPWQMKSIISVSSRGFMCRATVHGFGEHLGVIDGHIDVQAAEVGAADALRNASFAREEIARRVEPGIVTIARGFDHQRVAFPVGDGVTVPRRQHVFGEFAAVEKDLAVAGVEFVQDDELGGRLENLLGFGEGPGARIVGGHAVRVGVDVGDVLGAALDQIGGPGLVGEAALEARREVHQLRRQGKFGALHAALLGIAGQDIARDPHAGEVGLTTRGLGRGGGEIGLAIAACGGFQASAS